MVRLLMESDNGTNLLSSLAAIVNDVAAAAIVYENNTNQRETFMYSPPIQGWVFTAACCFLSVIGTFGFLSNLTIFILFATAPLVRISIKCSPDTVHRLIY